MVMSMICIHQVPSPHVDKWSVTSFPPALIIMAFAPRPGCPLCSIVAAGTSNKDVVWRDGTFTAYRETAYPVSSKGHIVFAFK